MPQIAQIGEIFASQLFWLAIFFGAIFAGGIYEKLIKPYYAVEEEPATNVAEVEIYENQEERQ